jgi:hypothetical protein
MKHCIWQHMRHFRKYHLLGYKASLQEPTGIIEFTRNGCCENSNAWPSSTSSMNAKNVNFQYLPPSPSGGRPEDPRGPNDSNLFSKPGKYLSYSHRREGFPYGAMSSRKWKTVSVGPHQLGPYFSGCPVGGRGGTESLYLILINSPIVCLEDSGLSPMSSQLSHEETLCGLEPS